MHIASHRGASEHAGAGQLFNLLPDFYDVASYVIILAFLNSCSMFEFSEVLVQGI